MSMITGVMYFHAMELKSNITKNTQNLINMKKEMENFINFCNTIGDQISKVYNLDSLQELEWKIS